jgi:ribosome-associated protein
MKTKLRINPAEVRMTAVRSQGAGGQNVNKVSSAAHLRFDVPASSLPEAVKQRLLALPDQRVGDDGTVVIKAQTHRSLPRNQADAVGRLQSLVDAVAEAPKARKATRPTRASNKRRLHGKTLRAATKSNRRPPDGSDV